MKMTVTTSINANISEVWKVLAEDFDKAHEWMAVVPTSTAITNTIIDTSDDAPVCGRVCDLSNKGNKG